MNLDRDEQYQCTIEKLVYEGYGLARINGHTVFVPKSIPGDELRVCITQRKRRVYFAKIVDIIKPSPLRQESPCSHAHECGGCQLMDVAYENQLLIKRDIYLDVFRQFAPRFLEKIEPVVPCERRQYHRNKMDFSFFQSENDLMIGLKKKGSFSEVIRISDCLLLSQESNAILLKTSEFFSKKNVSVWDPHAQTGCLRHLMIRHSKLKNKYLVAIEASCLDPSFDDYVKLITQEFPSVLSLHCIVVKEKLGITTTKQAHHLFGDEYLIEAIGALQFKISPLSFFQTNSYQVKVLYDLVKLFADLKPDETLLDLYCGTGSIGLYCADSAKAIIGVEENPDAIRDAHENARINRLSNTSFYEGRVKNILKFNTFPADCIVVDPPRSGMVPKALKRLLDIDCKRIVYVSCNPVTLARDLLEFEKAGYTIERIVPVDMFPHSYHIESVVKLRLNH